MLGIVLVVSWQDDPFVAAKDRTLLQALSNATEHFPPVGGVAGGLNLVGTIESFGFEFVADILKVALDDLAAVVEALHGTVLVRNFDLVLVERDTGYTAAGETSNVAHRTSDAASDVEDLVALSYSQLHGKEKFGPLDTLFKGFSNETRCEMKRLSPSPFIKVRYQVVKGVHHTFVLELTLADALFRRYGSDIFSGSLEQLLVSIDGILDVFASQDGVIVGENGNRTGNCVLEGGLGSVTFELSSAKQKIDDDDQRCWPDEQRG
mmetsp:Transcript_34153/g.53391  ORF Transcript_34153/g.53391 Transcript_34153/m.53391 type:complete len:264 (+) Transcript_34153:258-1049(+)